MSTEECPELKILFICLKKQNFFFERASAYLVISAATNLSHKTMFFSSEEAPNHAKILQSL